MIRIGNAQGFWGDSADAPAALVAKQPDIDFLTMDYLAEVSMSILALQREKDPSKGYAADFVDQVRSLIPFWKKGARFKVVVNAGGLNPRGCGEAVLESLKAAGMGGMKVGVVLGDDVSALIRKGDSFENLDTGNKIDDVRSRLVSANAYLGAKPIVEALKNGADIVITGRSADPSLAVACAAYRFGWDWKEYDKLAGATIAGHLLECGAQATGGISTNWLDIPDPARIGYPIVEMQDDGSFVLTKPENTGGAVTIESVKEQLLYEIGDPKKYLSPDAIVSFLGLKLEENGKDRIMVTGARGSAPPDTYKVSATYSDGYMAAGTLTLYGRHLREKAKRCGEIVLQRVMDAGYVLEESCVECIGGGDVVPGLVPPNWDLKECVLRIAVKDFRKDAVERFVKEIAPLVTSGPQGTTGYFGGRPKVRPVFGFWPCSIAAHRVNAIVEILEVQRV